MLLSSLRSEEVIECLPIAVESDQFLQIFVSYASMRPLCLLGKSVSPTDVNENERWRQHGHIGYKSCPCTPLKQKMYVA